MEQKADPPWHGQAGTTEDGAPSRGAPLSAKSQVPPLKDFDPHGQQRQMFVWKRNETQTQPGSWLTPRPTAAVMEEVSPLLHVMLSFSQGPRHTRDLRGNLPQEIKRSADHPQRHPGGRNATQITREASGGHERGVETEVPVQTLETKTQHREWSHQWAFSRMDVTEGKVGRDDPKRNKAVGKPEQGIRKPGTVSGGLTSFLGDRIGQK